MWSSNWICYGWHEGLDLAVYFLLPKEAALLHGFLSTSYDFILSRFLVMQLKH
jgi:hypothetical protein